MCEELIRGLVSVGYVIVLLLLTLHSKTLPTYSSILLILFYVSLCLVDLFLRPIPWIPVTKPLPDSL